VKFVNFYKTKKGLLDYFALALSFLFDRNTMMKIIILFACVLRL